MARTDRLYGIVAELRATPRSARELAERFGVGVRQIERDLAILRELGFPVEAGQAIADTLPPMNLSAAEAVAIAIALGRAGDSPHARSGLLKIIAAMSAADRAEDRGLAEEMRPLLPEENDAGRSAAREATARSDQDQHVPEVVEDAVAARQVLRLAYVGRDGTETGRDVEPVAFVAGPADRYLIGWCRLREAPRLFRLDRIRQAAILDEIAPPRDYEDTTPSVRDLLASALSLG